MNITCTPRRIAQTGFTLVVLLIATTLSVYKPRGLTSFGLAAQDETPARIGAATAGGFLAAGRPRWVNLSYIVLVLLVVLFIIRHLAGGGMGNHGM